MTRIAIIGGGISGLAAAFDLEEHRGGADASVDYVLYEASARLGGVLRTDHHRRMHRRGWPRFLRHRKTLGCRSVPRVGLATSLIGSNDADRKTYILTNGRLVEMPDGLMFMVPTKILPTGLSPLFSWKTKLRMTQELFHRPRDQDDHDESVASSWSATTA
jgi:oxygen-dependent protoporphyrinogen oxidase